MVGMIVLILWATLGTSNASRRTTKASHVGLLSTA